ncbi:MAG: thiamine pyrophosphate-dependent enzyme [Solirubrobacteraceae bacterium]
MTVREAALEVLRRHGLTTLFANPGSTEVPFLAGLPSDLRFVLGLHEGTVVGMATGWAIARGEPSVALLHTTAGLGNAVGALATARVNRAPLVVLVGQQDRRHLAFEPFLAGELDGLAGRYPVWSDQPARPADVPGAIARAWYEARDGRGPAIVIVPMDDWAADAADEPAAPRSVLRAGGVNGSAVDALAAMLESADAPVLVVGAGADDPAAWAGLVRLAERLSCPVWQEAFGARAGFPQDHPRFAGHLPAGRGALRTALAGHDLVLAIGAPVLRQYEYEPGRLVDGGTRVAVVTDDPDEAHRSPADLAVLASPAAVCAALAERVGERDGVLSPAGGAPAASPPADGEPLRAKHVLAALADRLPRDVVVVEETPSSRPDLHRLVRAREPLGFLSAAMGGLGFALPAAVGVRLARPDRPVVAVVGDGSSLYAIQALWSAARYRVGALLLVMANGGYAIMDKLAADTGKPAPWPGFGTIDIAAMTRAQGCEAIRIEDHADLLARLDEVLPELARRNAPLLLEIAVAP